MLLYPNYENDLLFNFTANCGLHLSCETCISDVLCKWCLSSKECLDEDDLEMCSDNNGPSTYCPSLSPGIYYILYSYLLIFQIDDFI